MALIPSIDALAPFIAPYPVWVKLALGITVVSFAITFLGLLFAGPSRQPPVQGGGAIHNVTSTNQQGGITAHTVKTDGK
jgi:hypothetical protein